MASVYDPNPRLRSASSKSSASSENDVDDVFTNVGKGAISQGAAVMNRNKFGLEKKNRCVSEPKNGKEIKKDSFKPTGKTQALSDSSNLLKRKEDNGVGGGVHKHQRSPEFEFEDITDFGKGGSNEGLESSDAYPQPESMRRAVRGISFAVLVEDDEDDEPDDEDNGFVPTGPGGSQYIDFDGEARGISAENDSVFVGDSARSDVQENVAGQVAPHDFVANSQHSAEDEDEEDDSLYPDIERLPKGYLCCPYDEFPSEPMFNERGVILRSYDGLDDFPELPEDLIKDEAYCSEMELEAVEEPELPTLTYHFRH